jgi:hypothetical protein
MNTVIQGLDEIAAEKEHILMEKEQDEPEPAEKDLAEKEPLYRERVGKEKQQKVSATKIKNKNITQQEEKLIEDVLKEFFA